MNVYDIESNGTVKKGASHFMSNGNVFNSGATTKKFILRNFCLTEKNAVDVRNMVRGRDDKINQLKFGAAKQQNTFLKRFQLFLFLFNSFWHLPFFFTSFFSFFLTFTQRILILMLSPLHLMHSIIDVIDRSKGMSIYV